jgi:hypothetical protein
MREDKLNKILDERQAVYGDASDNFKTIGRVWSALLGLQGDIPAYQVALMMDAFKTVRCFANPDHMDSWDDKLGYTQHGIGIVLHK